MSRYDTERHAESLDCIVDPDCNLRQIIICSSLALRRLYDRKVNTETVLK